MDSDKFDQSDPESKPIIEDIDENKYNPFDSLVDENKYNPWKVSTIYAFQYFNCPECDEKSSSKQAFVNHASSFHAGAMDDLLQITDGSLDDIDFQNVPPLLPLHPQVKLEPTDADVDDYIDYSNYYDDNVEIKNEEDGENKPEKNVRKYTKKAKKESKRESRKDQEKKHVCSSCGKKFGSPAELKRHVLSVHEKQKPYKCEICNKCFSTKNSQKVHITRVHEGKKPFTCDTCGKRFADAYDLKKHNSMVHEGVKYSCHICTDTFASKQAVHNHVVVKHELKDLTIDEHTMEEIGKIPEVAALIKRKPHKKYYCKICEKEVLFGKIAHIKKYHGEKDGNLKCPKCDKVFPTFILAKMHVMNQHEKTPCSLCGEMVSKAAMSRHIEFKHTEQQNRKYKCTFCGKGFAQSQALKDHINTHTGEKPYMCKFCGAAFANMGSHRMHERTVHLGHKRDEKSHKNNSVPADLSKHMPLPMGFSLKK